MRPEPVARPVFGYRAWGVDTDGTLLPLSGERGSAARRRTWAVPGVPARASCLRTGEPGLCAAAATCGCGLEAHTDAPELPPAVGLVQGVVIAWGRIVVHERGFRAQYALPVGLLERPGSEALERAAEATGLPVLDAAELRTYAGWHADPLALQPA